MASDKTRQNASARQADPWDGPAEFIRIGDIPGARDPASNGDDLTSSADQAQKENVPLSGAIQSQAEPDHLVEQCRQAVIGDSRRVIIDGEIRWLVKVFDPAQAKAIFERQGYADLPGSALIRGVADDPHAGWRRLPLGTTAMIERLAALAVAMPNFLPVTDIIRRAVAASKNTMTPLSLDPLILLGPAGIGKTRFAQELARILAEPFIEISMPGMNGTSTLLGQDPVWRNSRPGRLTETLSANLSAAPIFFCDEFEKVYTYQVNDQPLDVFHQLWEPQNARKTRDECTGLFFSASSVIWLASANEVNDIRPTILDRAHVIAVNPPTPGQMHAVVMQAYGEAISRWDGWFSPNIPETAFTLLTGYSPRQIKRVLGRALASAAADGRKAIEPHDVIEARTAGAGPRRPRIGFV